MVRDIRIGLVVGASRATVGGRGAVAAIRNGRPAFRIPAGRSVTLTPDGRAFRVSGAHRGRYEQLSFASLAAGRHVAVNDNRYRGVIEVIVRDGGLTVINALPLEDYLRGVVITEMGRRPRSERAALEAQAVVSRTYALKNRGRFGSSGYDLHSGVTDQVYGGVDRETDDGDAAVRATAGIVLAYQGDPIVALFHSTCGFSTAAPEEVFRTVRATPYLRPVSDRRPGGGYYGDIAPRFRWTVEWDGNTIRDILRRTLPAVLGVDPDAISEIQDIYVRRTGPSGRATDVRVRVPSGEIPVPGYAVRRVFETPEGSPLGSSAIEFTTERDGDRVTRVTVSGLGWGHGVGLCQWGAVGRARAGQDYRTIVTTYFPGSSLVRWY